MKKRLPLQPLARHWPLVLALALSTLAMPLAAQSPATAVARPVAATPLSGRVDLRPQMKILEEWRQTEYQRLRASGKATAADFKAVDDKFLSRARKAEGYRTDALNELNKHSGVEVKQGAGGTKPQEGRGLAGDIDTDSLTARNFDKVKKTAERMGYKVTHQGDSMTIEELNVTVHRQSAAEAKTGSRVGSSAHGAETGRGFNEETALGFKANNPNASVADNLKKAAHTLDTPPGKLNSEEVQKLGKMTGRNLEELGKLDPASAKKYETLQKQADMLKKGYSPEAAGIEDLGAFQQQAREASVKAVKTTEQWAQNRTGELTRQAQRAEEALTKARSSGDSTAINQARQQLEQAKSDLIGFKETQAAAKEAAVLNTNNGKSATSVMAEAKGIPTGGKPPSTVREQILAPDRNILSKTVNEPTVGAGRAAAGEAAATGMGAKVMKGAMGILAIYGIITGVKEGASQAGEESARKGDSTMVSILKTAGYSLWHGLGFGAAKDTGERAGDASAKQWAEDVKAGRVDPNSKLSQTWAKLRAVGWGLAEFTGLQAIKDAAVEGGGYVKDRYTQYKAEKQEAQQKKDVADKKAGEPDKNARESTKDKTADPAKDQSDKTQADKDKTAKDKADKEKAEKEKTAQAEKERTEKEKAEKAEKERAEKAAKEAHERRERAREKAEKERQAAERQAREKAEKERQARERAEAAKQAAAKAAQQAQKPSAAAGGTHEEVSGVAKTASGSTKLTYIKDAAGNVLGGYYTNYDKNGREISKEYFKNKPDTSSSDSPAGKESYNGSYSGRVSGGASGALNFTVRNGILSGRISGNYQGDGAFATLSGTVDAAGNVRISAPGYVRGALGDKGKMENWEFEGVMTGKIRGKQASGTWSAKGFGASRGSWSAAR